jgi:hypothetical protein
MTGARIRYADGALDDVASILCAAHPLAADYLAQAPVLAVLACEKFGQTITYGEMDRFKATVASGAKLKAVLASYGAPAPIRKLTAQAVRMKDRAVIKELVRLDPSSLSQFTPSAENQRLWLAGISGWLRLTPSRKSDRKRFSVAWAAKHLAQAPTRCTMIDALVDFVARGDRPFNEAWSWDKAISEVEAWHARLNDQRSFEQLLRDKEQERLLNTVICKAPLPDVASVDGFDFIVLRTGRALREEGITMHHCVASYAYHVDRGQCAIVSIRRDGVHLATLEINRKGVPVQIKAHCNQTPSADVRRAADAYALSCWQPVREAA